MEMTKWFDTNYHYIVPELHAEQAFTLSSQKPIDEFLEAKGLGIVTRPVLIGPDLRPGTVLTEVWSDPRALLIAAGLVLCLTAVFTALVIPMITCGWKAALVCLLPYLGMILLGAYLANIVLEKAPTVEQAALWVGVGIGSLVLLTASLLLVWWVRQRESPEAQGARG